MALMLWHYSLRPTDALLRVKRAQLEHSMSRGCALLREQRYVEALAAFTRALAYQPDYAPGWRCKAFALAHLRRPQEALAAAEQAIALDPGDPLAYQSKGRALSALGRYAEALDACAEARRLAPESIPALWEELFSA